MTTSGMTSEVNEIVSEIQIAALPERVFEALVDPRQVVQWWGQKGVYQCREFHADVRSGGEWRSAGLDGQGNSFEVGGEFIAVDRPRLLSMTWVATWTGDLKTVVRWDLEAKNEGTLVRIRHSGFAAHPELTQAYRGWPRMLGWLQALIERGETVEDREPATWATRGRG